MLTLWSVIKESGLENQSEWSVTEAGVLSKRSTRLSNKLLKQSSWKPFEETSDGEKEAWGVLRTNEDVIKCYFEQLFARSHFIWTTNYTWYTRQILALAHETDSGPGSSSSLLSTVQSRLGVHMELVVWSMKTRWQAHCDTVLLYPKLIYTNISTSQLSLNLSLYKKK